MRVPVTAPMLGKVWKLVAQPGQRVEEEETVLILEAMKMEIEVVAPAAGTVVDFKVAEGDSVDADDEIAYIETD